MIKAVIIEDEPRNVVLLEELIKTHCGHLVELKGDAGSITTAVSLIQKTAPDLVYLDIELKDGNAFELIERLGDFSFQIIFITAFNDYAVRAFRLNAVDYLLKPISASELKDATLKAINKIDGQLQNENILQAIKQLKANTEPKKIGLNVSDGVVFVNVDEIISIEAKGNYSILFLIKKKKITCIKTLKEIEDLLPDTIFLRVHHSWIINTNYIKKYYRGKNCYVEMDDGSTVSISTRKKEKLVTFFGA